MGPMLCCDSIDGARLPPLQWIGLAIAQSRLLLFPADVQVVFHDLNARADEHVFEGKDLTKKAFVFLVGAKPHDVLDAGPVVPTPVEHDHFLRRWKMRHVSLEVPGRAIMIRRLAESDNAGLAWAQMLNDALDRAVLSAGIPTLKNDQDLMAVLDDVPLHLDEFVL